MGQRNICESYRFEKRRIEVINCNISFLPSDERSKLFLRQKNNNTTTLCNTTTTMNDEIFKSNEQEYFELSRSVKQDLEVLRGAQGDKRKKLIEKINRSFRNANDPVCSLIYFIEDSRY